MDKKGLKIAFLGDSITEGCGASTYEKSFVGLFEKNYKDSSIYNFGIGGTRIATNIKPYNEIYDANPFYTRVNKMPLDLDLLFVFGGTNDFGHGDAKMGDILDKTEYTFYGALNLLLERLIKRYPKTRIIFLTPLHRADEFELVSEVGIKRYPFIDYINAIRNRCEYYSIPLIDLYSTAMINPTIKESYEAMTVDGLHPNDDGYKRLYEIIDSYIRSL